MSLHTLPNKEGPTWQIMEHLQRSGSGTIKELEQVLGVTTTAVRQHLSNLLAEGYIERRRVNTGVGRPHHAYVITDKAQGLFACHCDDLALTLLEEVFAIEGKEMAGYLLGRVSERLANKYSESIRSTVLQERVGELAEALNQRGVLADVATEEDTFVLKTYNCPFHDLAQEHEEICVMDENMMEKALGSSVNLSSRMMDGHACCSFVVTENQDGK